MFCGLQAVDGQVPSIKPHVPELINSIRIAA